MTLFNQKLESAQGPFVAGDAFGVTRNITGLPVGRSLAPPGKAWLTIKKAKSDLDAAAILQKVITTTNVPGTGQITDSGAGDQEADLLFEFTAAESAVLGAGRRYHYDIQLMLDNGEISTYEIGTIQLAKGVTDATS